MDYRVLIASVVGLVFVALGGFFFAFSTRSLDFAPPMASSAPASAAGTAVASAPGGKATAASIEAELKGSELGELIALLKQNFADEYQDAIAFAVRKRNEGVSGPTFGEELLARMQQLMRGKLKFAVAADMSVIDRLVANEINLFRALGTEGAAFCPKVLGKDSTPPADPMSEDIQHMMRLGALHRFQAIVDGMPRFRPVEPLNVNEAAVLEAALARVGLKLEDVRSGAFLGQGGNGSGAACLMIEKVYRTIAGLDENIRRKLYAGMFFLGRDN